MGYLNSGIGAARINDSSPSDYTTYSGNKIETKQNSTDNTLTTTSKTIVGAINEVNSKVNNKFIVAQTLPVSDIDEFAIYLVPKSTAQINNIYDEYIYISTDTPAHWKKIGDTEIDLSGYYTSSQVDNLLDDKQDATDNSLTTTDKTIVGAINELHAINGYSYDEYDPTTAYSKDDLCIYNNTLYKALQATTGNLPINTTYWEQTSIAVEIDELKNDITTANYWKTSQLTIANGVSVGAGVETQPVTITVPQYTGYTVLTFTEVRATGYHGAKVTVQAELANANELVYALYNPSDVNATVTVTVRVIYVKTIT